MTKQNTVKWFIEDIANDDSTKELIQAARDLGYDVKEADLANPCDEYTDYFEQDSCVVAQTSIQSAERICKYTDWLPAIWDNVEQFSCKYYYQFFGDYLFNDKYIMLPLGEVERRLDDLYDWLGSYETIFIRPSSGRKTFTGQLFERKHFHKDWHAVIGYGGQPTDLVVASTPKVILGEYRYVIGDRKIIASSQYSWDGKPNRKEAPGHLNAFVDRVLADTTDYNPCSVWILDVCLDAGMKPYVLEVGAFSCSGLYACDKKKIVEGVSEIALREYKEFSPTFITD
jgi:hypothetical protein